MPASLRTRIDAIEPSQVLLTQGGRARVRVSGFALGLVTCAGERRLVWGSFDESFLVECTPRPVTVRAYGFGGSARMRVQVQPGVDLRTPEVPGLRRLRFTPFVVPGVQPLTSQLLAAMAETAREANKPERTEDDDQDLERERT